MGKRTREPLAAALAVLLSEHRADHYGRWAMRPFYQEVADAIGTHTPAGIRSMIEGRTRVTLPVLRTIARLLDLDPDFFREYRLARLNELLEEDDDLLDLLYDIATKEEATRAELHGRL